MCIGPNAMPDTGLLQRKGLRSCPNAGQPPCLTPQVRWGVRWPHRWPALAPDPPPSPFLSGGPRPPIRLRGLAALLSQLPTPRGAWVGGRVHAWAATHGRGPPLSWTWQRSAAGEGWGSWWRAHCSWRDGHPHDAWARWRCAAWWATSRPSGQRARPRPPLPLRRRRPAGARPPRRRRARSSCAAA